jgi:abortive infection bacteriophage resistance protein
MLYCKPAVSIPDQIITLKARGLAFGDEAFAVHCLSNISYYRLRAYTYPFQDNTQPDHPFKVPVTFEQIIDLYVFDRKLRGLVFDAMEKIEIAMRTQIIHQWAIPYGSHWQLNETLFRNTNRFNNQILSLQTEISRSNETFIEHYKTTYSQPVDPPSWMSLEVSSFGLLSQMFRNLKKSPEKIAVAKHFGLNNIDILENWMLCFSHIRNTCAHHGRLWNRRLTAHIILPKKPANRFIQNTQILPYKPYAALCCMQYVLQSISSDTSFKDGLKALMKTCPLKQEKEMGFSKDWSTDPFWA